MKSPPVDTLQSEEAVLGRIRTQHLIESLEQMSPIYVEGMKRILTVSADTELISAPAYYHAAVHAPSLNAFGWLSLSSRMSWDMRISPTDYCAIWASIPMR